MSDITLTQESKNSLSITNDSKPSNQTFDDMPVSFDSAHTPFSNAGEALVNESKNSLTITNETKN